MLLQSSFLTLAELDCLNFVLHIGFQVVGESFGMFPVFWGDWPESQKEKMMPRVFLVVSIKRGAKVLITAA